MLSGVVHWCPQNSMASVVLAQWCITEFSPWTLPLILGINPSFYGKTSKTYISLNILLPSMLPWRMLVVNANYYPGKTFMVDIPFVLPRKNDSYNLSKFNIGVTAFWKNRNKSGTYDAWCDGAMVRCNGALVRCDGTVRWCDGTVRWCDGTVRWYGAMVRWYGAMVWWYGTMVRWYGTMVCDCLRWYATACTMRLRWCDGVAALVDGACHVLR